MKKNSLIIKNNVVVGCEKNAINVEIPYGITKIGDCAFSRCRELESVTIPDSVTKIGDNAFFDCRSLSSIIIPNSVTNIKKNAFLGCSNAFNIYCDEGSVAEKYAKKNKPISYINISNDSFLPSVLGGAPKIKKPVVIKKEEAAIGDYVMVIQSFSSDKFKVGEIFKVIEPSCTNMFCGKKHKYGWAYINKNDFLVKRQYVVLKNHIPIIKEEK